MRRVALAAAIAVLFLASCGGNGDDSGAVAEPAAEDDTVVTFDLSSTAFDSGDEIPVRYSCDGENVSPDLAWTEPPEGAASFALIMDDPDAPGGTFTHWLAWDFGADSRDHPENTPGPIEGESSFGQLGYGGPCPPPGDDPHRYVFRLYALDAPLELPSGAGKAEVEDALEGRVLGVAELVGTFGRA